MTNRELAIYNALQGIVPFAKAHASDFPDTSKAKAGFARVPLIIQEIGPVNTGVGRPASPSTAMKQSLIDEVWDDLLDIARTSRTIAKDEPGFDVSYRLGDNTHVEVISTAGSILELLKDPATAAKFVAYDLPADFVTDLTADLAAISGEGEEQDSDEQDASNTTEAVRGLIREGSSLIDDLNTSVRNRYRTQPEVLAEWKTASHIRRRNRKQTDGGTTSPAAPTPAPAK